MWYPCRVNEGSMWYRCSVDVVVVVVEGKQLKCGGGSGGGGGGGKITNKLTRSRLGEFIISIESKIRKRRNNENPPHFSHVIKTKGYDVVGLNVFLCKLMRFLREKRAYPVRPILLTWENGTWARAVCGARARETTVCLMQYLHASATLLRLTKATMKFDVKLTVVISSGFAVNM